MKKNLLIALFATFGLCASAAAQEVRQSQAEVERDSLQQVVTELSDQVEEARQAELNTAIWKNRAKYFNVGYVIQNSKPVDPGYEYRSKLGVSLVWGRTYYLHRKPLARMIKFGLDFSWMDLNYAKYSDMRSVGSDGAAGGNKDLNLGAHQLEYGLQFGPSVTINPVDHLKISAYFRVVPSASLVLLEDNINANYATFFATGGAISWRVISLGVEGRWGQARYSNFSMADDAGSMHIQSGKSKRKTSAVRIYVGFRF